MSMLTMPRAHLRHAHVLLWYQVPLIHISVNIV